MNAAAAIGTVAAGGKTQVTLTAYGHAKRTMTEHFNTNQFARRAANFFFLNGFGNGRHLLERELSG